MQLNLNDWLGQVAWPWWLLVVLLFLGAALVTRRALVVVMAMGPLAAAGLAAAYPRPFWPQLLLALLVGGVLSGLAALFTRPNVSDAGVSDAADSRASDGADSHPERTDGRADR